VKPTTNGTRSGPLSDIARELGRRGGAATKGVTSPAKVEAARENGRKGGRPRTTAPYYSALDAAELLCCSRDTVHDLIAAGKLKAWRLNDGGWWRVDRTSVEKYLAARIRANGHRSSPRGKR
jgi:excisionase family DNA binding protein